MRRRLALAPAAVRPEPGAVHRLLGLGGRAPDARTAALCAAAADELERLAEPLGLWQDAAAGELAAVFAGEGLNDPAAPLGGILLRAARGALFVATVGPGPGRRVAELFAAGDFAGGAVLDAVASAAADRVADGAERDWTAALAAGEPGTAALDTLRYSPGYCGWHVTAQRRLFAALRPEAIGVTLNPDGLMEPLKSVSGLFVAGPPGIHEFEAGFAFCRHCKDRTCRERRAAPGPADIPNGG